MGTPSPTPAEGLMSNNAKDLEVDHNIEITYDDTEGIETVLRLKMLTGVTVNGQAVKCKEMLDVLRQYRAELVVQMRRQAVRRALCGVALRQNKILPGRKKDAAPPATQPVQDDILTQIQKLSALKDAGILTDEEFQAKKTELLARM